MYTCTQPQHNEYTCTQPGKTDRQARQAGLSVDLASLITCLGAEQDMQEVEEAGGMDDVLMYRKISMMIGQCKGHTINSFSCFHFFRNKPLQTYREEKYLHLVLRIKRVFVRRWRRLITRRTSYQKLTR